MTAPFPPTEAEHIAEYEQVEVVAGFLDFKRGDLAPGPNHSPAYRWGWANRWRDCNHEDDGNDWVRHQFIKWDRKNKEIAALTAHPHPEAECPEPPPES